jgi:hypothetical protein
MNCAIDSLLKKRRGKSMNKKTTLLCTVSAFVLSAALFAADVKVIVEAEKYKSEKGGSIKTAEGRAESSGDSCILNWNDKGHIVDWDVEIPADGAYKIVLRYSGGRTWNVYRDIKIDGKIPAKEFEKILLAPTGGFTKTKNFWQNLTVADTAGKPVLINLKKGKHVLTMANLGGDSNQDGAANFDSIGFLGKDTDANVMGKPGN